MKGAIWGPLGKLICLLAFDTGASDTLIRPEVLERVGYEPKDAVRKTTVTSVIGVEPGLGFTVSRFRALGFQKEGLFVNGHRLPKDCGLDGLLGLNFLGDLNYEIRSRDGMIRATRA